MGFYVLYFYNFRLIDNKFLFTLWNFHIIFFKIVTKSKNRNGSFQIDGFTLGELLIVILIISVLISIVIPVFF